MKEKINLEKLGREYFETDKQYENYTKSHTANNTSDDNSKLGDDYIKAIWNLINLFIKEKNCNDSIVKKSPDYNEFSGFQVEFAQNFYNKLMEKNYD